jgi:hypothetical protein
MSPELLAKIGDSCQISENLEAAPNFHVPELRVDFDKHGQKNYTDIEIFM